MSTAALFTVDAGMHQRKTSVKRLRAVAWTRPLSTVVTDLLALLLASTCTSLLLRVRVAPLYSLSDLAQLTVPLALLCSVGLYGNNAFHPSVEMRKVTYAMALAAVVLAIGGPDSSVAKAKAAVGISFLLRTAFLTISRTLLRSVMIRFGYWLTPTILVGAGSQADHVLRALKKHPHVGLKVVAVVNSRTERENGASGRSLLDRYDEAEGIARKYRIRQVLIAEPELRGRDLEEVTYQYQRWFSRVLLISDNSAMGGLTVKTTDLGGLLGLEISRHVLHPKARFYKRSIDFVGASLLSICFLPVFVVAYLAVRLTSPGAVFYGQQRIGKDGRYFTAWKFRSMVPDADAVLKQHLAENSRLRQEWESTHKLLKDPRILPVGRLLRKTSFDELPQLWNVIKGEMSLVGPRPIVDAEVWKYGESFDYYKAVRPGVTGMWQISGRSNTSYAERVVYDEYYVKNWTIWFDVYILFRTVKTVIMREGAC